MKKYLFSILILVGILSFSKLVFADSAYQTPSWTTGNSPDYFTLVASTTLNHLYVEVASGYHGPSVYIQEYAGGAWNNFVFNGDTYSYGGSNINSWLYSNCASYSSPCDLTLSTPIILPAGSYRISVDPHNASLIYFYGTQVPACTTQISLDYPTATSTTDFTQWKMTANICSPYAPQIYWNYWVDYGTSSTTFQYTDNQNEITPATTTPLQTQVPKLNLLSPNQTYYARTRFSIGFGTADIIATSSVISFTLTTSTIFNNPVTTGYGIYASSSTATNTTQVVQTCNPDDPWYTFGVCKVLTFLFIPPTSTTIGIENATNNLLGKIPFGYVRLIRDKLSSVSYESTTTATIILPVKFGTQATTSLTMFDISSVDSYFGTGTLDIFRTAIQYLAWILYLIFLFEVGKSIL